MFLYRVNHCHATGCRNYMLEIPQANSDNTKYGKRSKQDVKSPPRYLSEFPVICFHTSMIRAHLYKSSNLYSILPGRL